MYKFKNVQSKSPCMVNKLPKETRNHSIIDVST